MLTFTDRHGRTLRQKVDPIDLSDPAMSDDGFRIGRRHLLKSPMDVYDYLPDYLQQTVQNAVR